MPAQLSGTGNWLIKTCYLQVYICCCDTDGYDWLMAGGASSGMATPTFRSTVCAACVDWLLHDDGQLSAVASRLAHIITDGQVGAVC